MRSLFAKTFVCICIVGTLTCPLSGRAQHQRFGIAAQTITLEGKGHARIAEAFCLDKHLFATGHFVPYEHVINEGSNATVQVGTAKPITLQEAIDRGIISIDGSSVRGVDGKLLERERAVEQYGSIADSMVGTNRSHFGVRFVSNVVQPVHIRMSEPTAFGETKGDLIGKESPILAAVKERQKTLGRASTNGSALRPKTASEIQDDVWKAQAPERILAELGYVNEPVNPQSFASALNRFQSEHALTPTGTLTSATQDALGKEETGILEELARIGFPRAPRDSDDSQLVTPVESLETFSRYHGFPVRGIYTEEMRAQAKKDAVIRDQIKAIASMSGGPDNILPSEKFPNVVTFFRIDNGIVALTKSGDKLDSWGVHENDTARFGMGPETLARFEQLYEAHALGKRSDEIAILPAGYSGVLDPAVVNLYIHDFLEGNGTTSEGSRSKTILVAVSPLVQGPSNAELHGETSWTQASANALDYVKDLQSRYGDKANVFVTNDVVVGIENLKHLPSFSKPEEMAIYVDGKISDRGIVESLFSAIDKTKIQVVAADEATPGQARVSLMVGDNDANFRDQVLKMADQGIFKDGVLALAKCGEGGELAFNSEILHRSQARAVIFYDQLINIQAVKDVLYEFTKELRENGVPDGDFRSAWLRSVDRAAANSTGDFKQQVLLLQGVHVQVQEHMLLVFESSQPEQS
jgi:hypothetical protein